MLPTLNEISRSISGAWALFRGDVSGLHAFDVSYEGFWRSFSVFFLLIPFYLVDFETQITIININSAPEVFDPTTRYYLIKILTFIADWFIFPLVALAFARSFQYTHLYVTLVVARNWCTLISILFFTVPAIFFLLGLLPLVAYVLVSLVSLLIVFRYHYIVIRSVLDCSMSLAIGLIALDTILVFIAVRGLEILGGY